MIKEKIKNADNIADFTQQRWKHETTQTDDYLPVIGEFIKHQIPVMKIFAKNNETLFLHGPTGSGKSRLALWCHHHSKRRDQAFEILDLSTIPEEMKMAALFGWHKGAFTGASQSSIGATGRAQNGTLFIDEIDKLSAQAQAGLLQLLDRGYYRPLGDNGPIRSANIRFIIGTNANLVDCIAAGKFRADLYYRINILPIRLPPLIERRDEIEQWARYMLKHCTQQNGFNQGCDFAADAICLLLGHNWPGNLRQLNNIVSRSFALAYALSCEQGVCKSSLKISSEHIRQSFAMDQQQLGIALIDVKQSEGLASGLSLELSFGLRRCAEQFVELALEKEAQGAKLDLSEAESFKGYVLLNALQKLQNKKRVYQLFGKETAIQNRTYQREIKRELQKTKDLELALGNQETQPWDALKNLA